MNDASNIPENEQPESIPTASGAAQTPDENTVQAAEETTAQTPEETPAQTPEETAAQTAEETAAQTPEETTAQPNTCPQCGAVLKPGASFCANCGAPVDGSDDVTYHIVRPEAERSYEDANFLPSDDAANTPPRYYTPDADAWAEKPKRKRRARRPRTARTPEQKRLITRIACLCLVCALLGGLGGGAVAGLINRSGKSAGSSASGSSGTLVTQPVSSDPSSASAIYSQACKQVVAITTEVTYTNYFGQTSSQASCGSGFFITEDGYVLTNYHVISTAHQYGYAVSVLTYDGTTYQATIVGVDKDNDIALLKIDATGMTPVTFGDSDSMSVGDTVYAVGNPLGELEFTMTSGMISALDRTITTSDGTDSGINMFQIDAAVNAGNSGGPVYNTSGQVIGIVTAKYSSSGVEGLGFAIPVNDAVAIANDLMKNGTVTDRAQLGITLQTIPDSAAQYYNMPDGAYVNAVNSGSCAEKAGLKAGDIITAIDDTAVSSGDALRSALRGYSAGESATLTVSRSGETLKLTVTFDRASDSTK